ncbi:MAG: cytochrome c maturation protein CcmE [Microthrixaceae bacterium]|nr:cytochrome c maturation protein CcmE [Microthrixaceae bacterium]
MDVNDDPESPDAAPLEDSAHPGDGSGFDLRPRTSAAVGGGRSRPNTKRYVAIGALVAVLVALAAVLFIGLNDAATFFYNVDEAVEQRQDLAGERFRMQGNVVDGSVEETADGVDFVITFNSVEVPVHHTGTPPELFGPEIPVVIEGSFDGEVFESDEILVRHDNEYDEEHPDRIHEAERDAQAASVDRLRSPRSTGGGSAGVGP